MGEIAEMMLDGTMNPETGEFNFDGEDGPGWPMTGAEAAEWRRFMGGGLKPRAQAFNGETAYRLAKRDHKRLAAFGDIQARDFYHWQIRSGGKVVVDWWPHKRKFRFREQTYRGDVGDLIATLKAHRG